MKFRTFARLSVLLLFALALLAARADDTATLTFRKVFKSSYPEYVEIRVSERGAATFDIRQLDESPNPQPFQVSPPLAAKMLALAAQLHNFRDLQLDVHRRIANLGQKTFRYERGSEAYETTFNYTVSPTANQLLEIFEGLSRQQEDFEALERTLRYERLGVNDALLHFESDLDHKLIPEPERLLGVLDQVAADSRVIEIARGRARALAERIRNSH
jgi:hypothetical protein